MRNFLDKIFSFLRFPTTLFIGLIAYFKIYNIYKEDIKNNHKKNIISEDSLFSEINKKIINNPQDVNDYVAFLIDRMGIIRYILPIVFWILIFNLIF